MTASPPHLTLLRLGQKSTRVLRHFAATRSLEVLALQTPPLLGAYLGGFAFTWPETCRLGLLFLGSLALTAHAFVYNDLAGHSGDLRDPQRATQTFGRQNIRQRHVALFAAGLLVVSGLAFAALGRPPILIGTGIALLSFVYSTSPRFGKGTPGAASLHHLLGGGLQFLLGYTLFHALDGDGVFLSLFFGLVFAAGHLTQEVRDYEGDHLNGIRTLAVVFGCRWAFLASFFLFSAAYALLITLSAHRILPKLLLGSPLLWVLHAVWCRQALRRGLGYETALWMQRRYRLVFTLIGLGMLTG